ncbi:SWIM zinc finger family protein [Cohnella silvisoli]|uniref:SWIM-type domain-containing protein n=1 Tax=Cohnella silvisoli TaxID=2873699 RepID=A0ABV1KMN7_9BACL|nr:hypothetical protein [Cohnella silvisoli]MCD9020323.1 hypothetical protein [Cohnella silvisoli]
MMIPTYDLDDDQWNMLVQDAADNFDDVTLNRGFQYYKQGRVLKLTIPSPRYVNAVVEGSERYQVEINLDFFSLSHCACPVSGNCKHMFAALLKYADLHNRSVHMLVNAKTIAQSKPPVTGKPTKPSIMSYGQAKQIAAKKAAESEALLKEQAQHIATMSIPEWHELFEVCISPLTQSSRNAQFVEDAMNSIARIKPPEAIDLLFTMHARLFVLSKLTKLPQDQSGYLYSYLAYHAHHAASDLQDAIWQSIIDATALAAEPHNDTLVGQTLTYLRKEMLGEANENHYFLFHYLGIWCYWIYPNIDNGIPYSKELQLLEAVAGELGSSLSPFALALAQAGMHLYLTNDSEAWKLLDAAKKMSDLPSDYLFHLLDYLSQTEQWSRLRAWLIEIAPLLSMKRNNKIHLYSDYWDLTVHHLPEAEQQMWDTFSSLLPYSRTLYEDKLLANGRWERWMDFQLSSDCDPRDFRVTELQPLEKNAPELLLPFYHQAVERCVLVKNRDGYKAAVKLLKRLAKLYKKMKQESRWELFLTSFASRNSRLRALQEELRKGKLLE